MYIQQTFAIGFFGLGHLPKIVFYKVTLLFGVRRILQDDKCLPAIASRPKNLGIRGNILNGPGVVDGFLDYFVICRWFRVDFSMLIEPQFRFVIHGKPNRAIGISQAVRKFGNDPVDELVLIDIFVLGVGRESKWRTLAG